MAKGKSYSLEENPLLTPPKLALKIGLNEAMLIQQIHYWLLTCGKELVYDPGRKWIYNTHSDWQEQFPFWSINTVRRAIDSLVKQGLVITGNYNKKASDKTLWYSINYDELNKLINDEAIPKMGIPNDEAIPKMGIPIHQNGYTKVPQNGYTNSPKRVDLILTETTTETNTKINKENKHRKKTNSEKNLPLKAKTINTNKIPGPAGFELFESEYINWFQEENGVHPLMERNDRLALKKIMDYLINEANKNGYKNEEPNAGALQSWQYILKNWNAMNNDFLKKMIKPHQMQPRLDEIIAAIKGSKKPSSMEERLRSSVELYKQRKMNNLSS